VIQSVEDTLIDLKMIQDDDYLNLTAFNYFIDTENYNDNVFMIVEITPFTTNDKK